MDLSPSASFSSLPPDKSQGIHASATKAFGKLCFSVVPLLYTQYSLETFVKICGHPIFGSCVRRVGLSHTRFDPDDFDSLVQEMASWRLTRKELVQTVQLLSARCDAEEFLVAHDVNSLLEQAFYQLAKFNHSLTITISPNEFASIGRREIYLPDEDTQYFYADVPFTSSVVLQSAKRAGCRVSKLDIAVASLRFCRDTDYDLSALMSSVSELSLELTLIQGGPEPQDFIQWIKNLLFGSTDVKNLDVCCMIFDDLDHHKFDPFGQLISRLPLEELSLSDIEISQQTMTNLVENLGPTLRRLCICSCDLDGSWKEVLVALQQYALQLENLQISGSRQPWPDTLVVSRGITGVRLAIDKMLRVEQRAVSDRDAQGNEE
ncbi:unnamed protein product [Aureobasidium uvarum]|uniref:Uncharacterized protein n=1 Tax=Aureobasidium uvarum TaxID=2773716 RepID=A0A9N8PQW6_9PEZI|nr:unnamed protein product [Aureobasidium uvarum]